MKTFVRKHLMLSAMDRIKLLLNAMLILTGLTLTGCDEDTTYGKEPEYCPWFTDCDETESMKTVVIPAEGGETIVPTKSMVPLYDMFTNVTVTGNKTSEIEIVWNDNSTETFYDPGDFSFHSEFDWCNPYKEKIQLYVHEWLGVWQEPGRLHLYVQPNTGAGQRVMHIQPQNIYGDVIYGFLTVVQEGKAE